MLKASEGRKLQLIWQLNIVSKRGWVSENRWPIMIIQCLEPAEQYTIINYSKTHIRN